MEFTTNAFVMTDKVTEKDFTPARLKKLNTILESGKTVALLYSIHCGHCHDFMPSWKEFRAQMGKKVNVVVLEATAVQHIMQKKGEWHSTLGKIIGAKKGDRHPAVYFPMIIGFFKKSTKVNRKEYQGDRSPQDLMDFVSNNVKLPASTKPKTVKSAEKVEGGKIATPMSFQKIHQQLDDILGKMAKMVYA